MAHAHDDLALAWWKSKFGDTAEVAYPQLIEELQNRFYQDSKFIPLIVAFIMDVDYNLKIKFDEFDCFVQRHGTFETAVANCVKSMFDADGELQPWWHGKLDRDEANKIIVKQSQKQVGSFLLRFSTQPKSFALAYTRVKNTNVEVKNVLIDCNKGKFNINSEQASFDSIPALLENNEHTKKAVPIKHEFVERIKLVKANKYTQDQIAKIPPQGGKDGYGGIEAKAGNYGAIAVDNKQPHGSAYSASPDAVGLGAVPHHAGAGSAYAPVGGNDAGHGAGAGAYGAISNAPAAHGAGAGAYGAVMPEPDNHAKGSAYQPI